MNHNLKRWMKYVKPYWPYFVLGPLCMIIEVVGEMIMPKTLAMIIDYGVGAKPMEEASAFVRWIYSLCGENASPFILPPS